MGKDKMTDMVENKDRFMKLSKEVYPLMDQIKGILEKNGFDNEATHLTIGNDRYLELSPYETGWRMHRYSTDNVPKVEYDFREEILLGEV